MPRTLRVIVCECIHSDIIPQDVKRDVSAKLHEAGIAVDTVPDLCGLAARRDPMLEQVARADSIRIVACFPRAVKWLFDAAGAPLPAEDVGILNMRTQSAEEIVRMIVQAAEGIRPQNRIATWVPRSTVLGRPCSTSKLCLNVPPQPLPEPRDWVPWFPVIDRDRCTECRQCMNFCLFGVYGVSDEGEVEVRNPEKCKTNCPACARLCPQVAIIFPKYGSGPICGDDVREEDTKRGPVNVDVASLVGGDVYDRLRRRRKAGRERFSTKRDDEPSLAERAGAFKEVLDKLEVPPEVRQSICSDACSCGCVSNSPDSPEGPDCSCNDPDADDTDGKANCGCNR